MLCTQYILAPYSTTSSYATVLTYKIQMENIGNFLSACEAYGVPKSDLFQTVDLYEGQNIPQVKPRSSHNQEFFIA